LNTSHLIEEQMEIAYEEQVIPQKVFVELPVGHYG
jgi:hypothetical protein